MGTGNALFRRAKNVSKEVCTKTAMNRLPFVLLKTHRFDCVNASVEARGDNVRMETHKFDGHTQTKRRLGAVKVRWDSPCGQRPHVSEPQRTCLNTFNVMERR